MSFSIDVKFMLVYACLTLLRKYVLIKGFGSRQMKTWLSSMMHLSMELVVYLLRYVTLSWCVHLKLALGLVCFKMTYDMDFKI